jgi:TATA-box binding protein (TBP) (component of TFIID and TFIIIB)
MEQVEYTLDKVRELVEIDELLPEVKISTIGFSLKINTQFNVANIHRYITKSKTGIVSTVYLSERINYENVATKYKIDGDERKHKFENQVSVNFYIDENSTASMKVFINGSVQLAGVKSPDHFIKVMCMFKTEILKKKAIFVDEHFVDVDFLTNRDIHINNMKVNMINATLYSGKLLNKDKLLNKLLADAVQCKYPSKHVATIVTYVNPRDNREITIFVFESGAINISGAMCIEHINNASKFILNKLEEYGEEIYSNISVTQELVDEFLKKQKKLK